MDALWFPSPHEVVALHDEILRRTGGERGVLQPGAVASAIERARRGRLDRESDLAERAAFLLRGIAQDHPFVDGNKRTAVALTQVFLAASGWRLRAGIDELESFVVAVADARVGLGVAEVAAWLRIRLENIDEAGRRSEW